MKEFLTHHKARLKRSGMVVGLVLLVLVPSSFFYWKYQAERAKNPVRELEEVLAVISKSMELPSSKPTLATVTDKDKLESNPFFSQAQNGDKVLIYLDEQKAILYRPSTKKIVDVTPIRPSDAQLQAQVAADSDGVDAQADEAEVALKVAIFNGTTTVGLTKRAEDTLKSKLPSVTISTRENASATTYTQTQVFNLSGAAAAQVQQIAEAVGGTVVSALPEGERQPAADVLIIVGSSFATSNPTSTPTNQAPPGGNATPAP